MAAATSTAMAMVMATGNTATATRTMTTKATTATVEVIIVATMITAATTTTVVATRLRSDKNDYAATTRPIRGDNQLLQTVRGGEDKREGRFGGIKPLKKLKWNRLSGNQLISTQSIPNQLSAHSRAKKAHEPIPHASCE